VGPLPPLSAILGLLAEGDVGDDELAPLQRRDPRPPYGRSVILDSPVLEGMVATWNRERWCAPHDHGGSMGGVRLLRGGCVHRTWTVAQGALQLVSESRHRAGEVLVCGADMIHAMCDGGQSEPLVTLHLYADPLDHMIVYDPEGDRTFVVEGTCGAWIPTDAPRLVRQTVSGIVAPSVLRAATQQPRSA
jgi:hypothetical protein